MKKLTINLFKTKKEAERYYEGRYPEIKFVPVNLCDEGKCNTYYSVYVKLANNRWMPLYVEEYEEPEYEEPEYVGE